MLLVYDKFSGVAPKITDPRLLPVGMLQQAVNCRFDLGGVVPLNVDLCEITPPKPGLKLSIFRYKDHYWFHWLSDVDAVLSPTPDDVWSRVYFTENGRVRVTDFTLATTGGESYPMASLAPIPPAPAEILTATPIGTPTDSDPTLQETRYYVHTFVNKYGSEGPPSLPSNKVTWAPGQTATITKSAEVLSDDYAVEKVNVYRTNPDAYGNEVWQLVYQIAYGAAFPDDDVDSAALGEILPSSLWRLAPTGITGLIPLPNAVMAGFVGNTVWLTAPGFPHAWLKSFPADRKIMGLGAIGSSVVVLTEGLPYFITGASPDSAVMERLDIGQGCVSKRSVVDMGYGIAYASAEGLSMISGSTPKLMTEAIHSLKSWRKYAPSTINAYLWQGKYVGFYSESAGFIFDPKSGSFKDLDFYASAGYYDQKTGNLFLQVGDDIVAFAEGVDYRQCVVKSRRETFPFNTLSIVKVIATAYPVSIEIGYPALGATDTVSVVSDTPQRIKSRLCNECEVTITGGVSAVFLASSLQELPR